LIPVVARDWKIRKSWRWKAPLDHGPTTRVTHEMSRVMMMPTARNGRKSRSGLTPEALSAATSRSPASRPQTSSTVTSSAIGSVRARKAGSMYTRSGITSANGTFLVMTRSVSW
jgi:hypothetical protein